MTRIILVGTSDQIGLLCTDEMRVFCLEAGENPRYQEQEVHHSRFWLPRLELGLGLWQGEYQGFDRAWLRWYDADQNWILTETEQERLRAEQQELRAEQQELRAEEERLRADQEAQARYAAISHCLSLGLTVEQVAEVLGFSVEEVRERS
jgi:hypothetical protein